MKEFYRLHCLARRKDGVPPQPFSFFHALHEHVIATGQGSVLVARAGTRTAAAAMFLHFGKRAIYKYAAGLARLRHLSGGGLVLWEAIRSYAAGGYESLSLGVPM